MKAFTLEEIEMKIYFHQSLADMFHNLWNEEKYDKAIFIMDESGKQGTVFTIDLRSPKCLRLLKDMVYELSIFHINERIKWEIALKNGSEPTAGLSL